MKRLLIAISLVMSVVPAHAQDVGEGGPCTGKVAWYTEKVGDGLFMKGDKVLEVGKTCGYAGNSIVQRQILKACPLGSRCTVEFTSEGDAEISELISVKRVK